MEMTSVRGKLNGFNPLANRIKPAVTTLRDTLATTTRSHEKFSTTNLAYPLNVEGDPQQGHYISFYARVTDPAKLKAYKQAKATIESVQKSVASDIGAQAKAGLDFGPSMKQIEAEAIGRLGVDKYDKAEALTSGAVGSGGVKSNSIQLMRGTTSRTKTAISLYMPPSVQVSYDSKYGDQNIGILAETGYNAIKAFMSPGGMDKTKAMKALGGIELGVKQAILKTLDVAAPGASTLFAIDRGKIITPKMELMFEGIGRRNFSFTFVFIPKSEQEAQVVKDIIYKFKYHMAADYVDNLREMTFPDMFDIEYMHIGKQNPNLNKISTCALTKMDVEYGGDRYVAYEGGVPQTTKLSLSFTEFDIITKKHIESGF